MDFARSSIEKPVITWLIIIACIAGGIFALDGLSRLEDPEFTIKEAVVITSYPGADPREVEQEVTERLEAAIQQMPQVWYVKSLSRKGYSQINVLIKKTYDKTTLPQIWDELRRKVNDTQKDLPPGAGPSVVNDDFGDVYGLFYAITGDGYSYRDLREYAKDLRRQLLLVPGIAKVTVAGLQPEQIFVEISRERVAQLGISPDRIYSTLKAQNLVKSSGNARVGDENLRITPSGDFDSVAAIRNIFIDSGTSKRLIRLGDVAKVTRGYKEIPDHLIRYDGKPAITIALSAVSGSNVVAVGERVEARLKELQNITPVGVQLHPIYEQHKIVDESVSGFIMNLLASVAIVIVVLLVFMGFRAGLLIGFVLFLSVMGTLLIMLFMDIAMQRISLGALIIAMGMLVDNAIVVTEGVMVRIQQGADRKQASSEIVKQTQWPLLGATIVGILAFAGIGLSPDSTGEYTGSLFYVIMISLLLSWALAVTVTPYFAYHMFRAKKGGQGDAYGGIVFRIYRKFLLFCLKLRWATVGVMVGLLALSIVGFGLVKQSFFPDSTTPIFFVDYWRAQGSDIRAVSRDSAEIEKFIMKVKGVKNVSTFVGQGATRFMLVYGSEQTNPAYAQFIVRVDDYNNIPETSAKILQHIRSNYPSAEPLTKPVRLGPGRDYKIEVRISGPDPTELRRISSEVQKVLLDDGGFAVVRDDWRNREKIVVPVFSNQKASSVGISRDRLKDALQEAFGGLSVGLYREGDELIPIIARRPDKERLDIGSISEMEIWSPNLGRTVPISQVISGITVANEDATIRRRDRIPTITIQGNPSTESANVVFKRIRAKIEAIKLPAGYSMAWGGEYEDSTDASSSLFSVLPLSFLAMILVVIFLFGKVRQPLIIWLCVPFALCGVVAGLLSTGSAFGFMALIGFLSLSGMLIKNAVVLVDQIDFEIKEGKERFLAVVDSSVSRVRPVTMAAFTTILGMIPLLRDAFFKDMAVTIMSGLAFATLLTLIIVPVLYAIFFRIKKPAG